MSTNFGVYWKGKDEPLHSKYFSRNNLVDTLSFYRTKLSDTSNVFCSFSASFTYSGNHAQMTQVEIEAVAHLEKDALANGHWKGRDYWCSLVSDKKEVRTEYTNFRTDRLRVVEISNLKDNSKIDIFFAITRNK
jgi:hypothetical protein